VNVRLAPAEYVARCWEPGRAVMAADGRVYRVRSARLVLVEPDALAPADWESTLYVDVELRRTAWQLLNDLAARVFERLGVEPRQRARGKSGAA